VPGFRFAPGGAQEYYGVTPDLATYGKIVGGGFALAAVAGRRELLELADPARRGRDDYVYMSGTLNANAVAAAAGLATLRELDRPGTYARLFDAGERIRSGLREVFVRAGRPAQVLGTGPIWQVMLTDEPVTDYRSARLADAPTMKRIAAGVMERGFLATGEKAYLSLAHTDDELDRTVEAFAESLAGLDA
jgi:glutamate-1-semialdehyde 2,1-aminomutase